MAYKYFTSQLVNSDLQLDTVFPELQEEAKNTLNVSYGLAEIAMYLQDVTNDFQKTDVRFIDFDNAFQSIVDKWFKKTNQKNPFTPIERGVQKVEKGQKPRGGVEIGGKKKKSIFAVEPTKEEQTLEAPPVEEIPETIVELPETIVELPPVDLPVEEAVFNQDEEKEILMGIISQVEEMPELADDADTMQLIYDQTMATFSYDEEEAKKWYEANGFEFDKYIK